MYILFWIVVGIITGGLIGQLLTGNGYGPIVDIAMGIGGAIVGGFIMLFSTAPAYAGLFYTSLAAMFGAAILTVLTAFTNGKRQLSYQRNGHPLL